MIYLEAALIIFAIQLFCFLFAAFFQTDKLTDISYGLTFALLAFVQLVRVDWLSWPGLYQAIFVGVQLGIALWGIRLALFLFYRIHKMGRDERFDGRRENVWRFAAFWALQAVSIWIIYLPGMVVAGLDPAASASGLAVGEAADGSWFLIGGAAVLGFAIYGIGLMIETVADQQKFRFRQDPTRRGQFIQSGLWKKARYPNYGGEILVWWGLFIATVPLLAGWTWLSVASPVWITILLLKISGVPLLEEAAQKKYGQDPAYQAYRARARLLWPI